MKIFQKDFQMQGVDIQAPDIFEFMDANVSFKESISKYLIKKYGYVTPNSVVKFEIDRIKNVQAGMLADGTFI